MFKKALLLGALGATLLVTRGADASGARKTGCTITGFEYDSNRIMLGVNCTSDTAPTTYFGYAGTQACGVSIDTLKVWASMIQSQLLAGRLIEMWVNDAATCAGQPSIGSVKMMP